MGIGFFSLYGYGDYISVTLAGRIIAMVLMFSGIGFLSFLTGTITTHYVNSRAEKAGVDSPGVYCAITKSSSFISRR